ncbi:hypothetical protein GCM10028787_07570 [Brachybacterium horti]
MQLDRPGDRRRGEHPPPARHEHGERREHRDEEQDVREHREVLRGDRAAEAQRDHGRLPDGDVGAVHGPAVRGQQQHPAGRGHGEQDEQGEGDQPARQARGGAAGVSLRGAAGRARRHRQYAPEEASTARTVRTRIWMSWMKDQLST